MPALEPQPARAETTQPEDSDSIVVNLDHDIEACKDSSYHLQYMLDQNTGRVSYCKNSTTLSPPATGTSVSYAGKTNNPLLDYVVYHGYFGDDSISIGGITGDADALYLATQLAIYDVLYDGPLFSERFFPESSQYRYISRAATQLYNEAVEYSKTGGGPEAGTAIFYKGSSDHQDILTITVSGTIRVDKKSSDPGISTSDSGCSLAGAEFAIYSDEGLTKEVARITTNESGVASSPHMAYGDYWVRETKAPRGFLPTDKVFSAHLAGTLLTISVTDHPIHALVGTVLTKVDDETGAAEPLGAGTLEGARFEVSFYAGATDPGSLPEKATRSWTFKTDREGKVTFDKEHLVEGDDLYTDSAGDAGLPLGVVVARETSAPAGYTIPEGSTWTTVVTEDLDAKTIQLVQDPVRERVIRGDVSFSKRDGDTSAPMAGILFRVTSKTTGESHVIMTGPDGSYSSKARAHSTNANALDGAVGEDGKVDRSKLANDYGTWFFGSPSRTYEVDDDRGACPYDTYVFQELPSDATLGHELVSFEVEVKSDGTVVERGDVVDPTVSITTSASDAGDGDRYLAREANASIVDQVSYVGLLPGSSYTLTTSLADGDTGTVIYADGKPCRTTTTLTPDGASGTITVPITIDTTTLKTSRLVVFERLERGGALIATHEDVNDQSQTLRIPDIDTTLTGREGGGHTVGAASRTQLVDTVSYKGLVPGTTYVLEGTLVDKDSKMPLTGPDQKPVTASTTFTATEGQHNVEVAYEVDTTTLGDRTIVAYETLKLDGRELCRHEDIDDADQSVTVTRHAVSLPQTGSTGAPAMLCSSASLIGCAIALWCRNRRLR